MKEYLSAHRRRILIGIICFLAECFCLFGSGLLTDEVTHFLDGSGSWMEEQDAGRHVYTQVFMPTHGRLDLVSFLAEMPEGAEKDGSIRFVISDGRGAELFARTLGYGEIGDGFFTDIPVSLRLKPYHKYRMTIDTAPSSSGEYFRIGVCGGEQKLAENRKLFSGEEKRSGAQLVARYEYSDALTVPRAWMAALLLAGTFAGIAFGLPRSRRVRLAAEVLLAAAAPYVLMKQLEALTFTAVHDLPLTLWYRTLDQLPFAFAWNMGIVFGVELILIVCTHRVWLGNVLTQILAVLTYSVNYFVILYRGTPLRVNDLSAAGTAAKVAGAYSFVPNRELAFAWATFVLFLIFSLQARERLFAAKKLRPAFTYAVSTAMAVLIGFVGIKQLVGTNLLERAGFENERFKGFYQDMLYYRNGFLVATCIEVRNARISPPADYSVSRVEEILGAAAEDGSAGAGDDAPHVFVIMNESFADLNVLAELDLNQDPMPFFGSLKENTVRGYVNSSILGGGTANSEFEMFTGATTAFFPVNYYPYQQAVRRPMNSMISNLKAQGYRTVSMHPEDGGNWNRINVYRYLGFDESLWKPDFEGEEFIHRGYSDAATYRRMIRLYEERAEDEKLFVFDLTMQNHGGYTGKDDFYAVTENTVQNPLLDEYLSLVRVSDQAFAELIRYFEGQDEKVIVCMFGDHQPWVTDLITKVYAKNDASPANLMKKYKTPFVIWANYDIEEKEGLDISMNYLGGLILQTADLPLSPFFSFLADQREKYPIVTINGYVDAQGAYRNWDSSGDAFEDYRMLQYNLLFDSDVVKWGY